MRTSRLITFATSVMAGLLLTGSLALAAPAAPSLGSVDWGNAINGMVMGNTTCAVGATLKYVSATKNEVTFWIDYNNTGDTAVDNRTYTVQGATEQGMVINETGTVNVAKGAHKVTLKNGATTKTVSFTTTGATKLTLQANIGGKGCTGKELNVLKSSAASVIGSQASGITPLKPGTFTINGAAATDINLSGSGAANGGAQQPATTCKIIAEGAVQNNTLLIGGAFDYSNLQKGSRHYTLRGFSEQSPNDIREYSGDYNAAATGNGYILNGDHGFLFELALTDQPQTYTITGTLDSVACAPISFAVPSKSAPAATGTASNNGVGGQTANASNAPTDNDVRAFGLSQEDAREADQLGLVESASDRGADDSANGVPAYWLYILLGVVAGLGGITAYLAGSRSRTHA